MAITDLTGTSWCLNANPNVSTSIYYKYIDFTSDYDSTVYSRFRVSSSSSNIQFYSSSSVIVYSSGVWSNTSHRNIHITGGAGVTDTELISWLEVNAIQITDDVNMYVGVNNVSAKITKGYVGVGDQSRKITHAYIGVNNQSQKIF